MRPSPIRIRVMRKSIAGKLFVIITVSLLAALSCGKEEHGNNTFVIAEKVSSITGTIKYSDGKPAADVVVSDSYSTTKTDASGNFSMDVNKDAYYVWYSIPSDAKVNIGTNGIPSFFQRITSGQTNYNFVIERQEVEKDFIILGLGDPQVKNATQIKRFSTEAVPDVIKFVNKHSGTPVYGMALGDMVGNTWDLLADIRDAMAKKKISIPVFMTIGNHDHEFPKSNDLLASRRYEGLYGPLNYSFNRGKLHIVSMDDVFHGASASDDYVGGLHEWQYNWLKKDLSYVPRDWSVLLCNHIAYKDKWNDGTVDRYHDEVIALLSEFASAAMIAGHSHNVNNRFAYNGRKVPEYIVGTTCGAWWHSMTCTDGAPNGYGVLEYKDSRLVNEYYKSIRFPEDYQMRLYPADEAYFAGGDAWYFSDSVKKKGRIVANVWGENLNWKFEVYEDGVLVANTMTKKSTVDPWSSSWFVNSEKLTSSSYTSNIVHMFYHDLKNPSANVKVVATDQFGNRYECDQLTTSVSLPSPEAGFYRDLYE